MSSLLFSLFVYSLRRFCVQGAKLVYYLYELLWRHLDKLSRVQRGEVDDVMDLLQHLGLSPLRLGTRISPHLRGSLEEVSASHRREGMREIHPFVIFLLIVALTLILPTIENRFWSAALYGFGNWPFPTDQIVK